MFGDETKWIGIFPGIHFIIMVYLKTGETESFDEKVY